MTANDLTPGERIALRIMEIDPSWADVFMPDGSARTADWFAEDGWLIQYTTERITGGPNHGRFAVLAFRPEGKGARSGKASRLRRVYLRPFASRKAAKKRAIALYADHSPRWRAKYGRDGMGRG